MSAVKFEVRRRPLGSLGEVSGRGAGTGGVADAEHLEAFQNDFEELGVGRDLDDAAVAVGLVLAVVEDADQELVE